MFLEARDSRQAASARLKEWVLLLARMGLVGLLAVALARPVVRRKWGGGEGRVTAVIILDRSYSMGFEEAGHILDAEHMYAFTDKLVDEVKIVLESVFLLLGGCHISAVTDNGFADTTRFFGRIDTKPHLEDRTDLIPP